jgi:hydrogenase maturation protease
MTKTIILGLGNDILSDDAAGILVARRLAPTLDGNPEVDVVESALGGMRIIELLAGYERAILVDAIVGDAYEPGEIYRYTLADFALAARPTALESTRQTPSSADSSPVAAPRTQRLVGIHDIDILTACELAELIGIPFPAEIEIIAIGAADVLTISEVLTPSVAAAVKDVAEELRERFAAAILE